MSKRKYVCVECGGEAEKKPCGKKGEVYVGLHGWKCNGCGKRGAKVKVI